MLLGYNGGDQYGVTSFKVSWIGTKSFLDLAFYPKRVKSGNVMNAVTALEVTASGIY